MSNYEFVTHSSFCEQNENGSNNILEIITRKKENQGIGDFDLNF